MGQAMEPESPRMTKRPPPRGGGVLIAFGLVAGAGVGAALGQPSLGLLAGFGIGVVLAIVLMLGDRR
jgi:UDP-N-acetylmuramyl pentapeptide phosphotransferase/UDP-N-acetylglucosamine-1-phosphate transferase